MQRVRKVGGSYQATGTKLGEFKTSQGKELIVFEFDAYPGMVHIFSPSQIEEIVPQTNKPPCFKSDPLPEIRAWRACQFCDVKDECLET